MDTESHEKSTLRRKRTKRACDRCSSSRTRCDGCSPCNRCREYDHNCTYAREVKRRGRKHKQAYNADPPFSEPNYAKRRQSLAGATSPRFSQHGQDGDSLSFAGNGDSGSLWQQYHGQQEDPETNEDLIGSSPCPDVPPQHSFPGIEHASDYHTPGISRPLSTVNSHDMSPPDFPVRSQPEVDSNTKSPLNRGVQASETVVSTPSSRWNDRIQSPLQHVLPSYSYSDSPRSDNPEGSSINSRPSCRYPILNPLIPVLEKIIPISVACELLELYFEQPGSSLLKFTSPYVLTHILRRRPILHPTHPRATSQGLLFAMLHATAHTADTACFYVPGSRAKICDALYIATVQHLRDSDDWHRMLDGGWERFDSFGDSRLAQRQPNTTNGKYSDDLGPTAGTDELLTLILLTVVVSGGTFKADCLRWWRKSINLARILKLNQLDSKRRSEDYHLHLLDVEAMEEKRRLFWLVFCLDRHLALSYNAPLSIFDADILVYLPLPEKLWEDIDLHFSSVRNHRVYGPSMVVSGTGFFEFFLPLMTILGDIVILHHRRLHPRFGTLEDADDTTVVEGLLEKCQHSIHELQESANNTGALRRASTATNGPEEMDSANNIERATYAARVGLVAAYGTHILHVLAVLLYGKWDPLDMLSTSTTSNVADEHNTTANSDDWVTPARFIKCASHAVSGSQAVAAIIKLDPELAFMPYLFGIYLLHGSFILLLFADRMPQLGGPNPEVEEACETIVRAHEICIVTLSTEFQRSFRRILRSTLYAVRSTEPKLIDPARRKALEMYRWTRGGRGLAL